MTAIVFAAVIGAIVPIVPGARRLGRLIVTIVHEVGHCVAVVPFGGRIRRIGLHADGSGEALVDLARVPRAVRGPVRTLNLFAGYGTPLWLGAGLVVAAVDGARTGPAIALGAVGLVALVFVRNAFGVVLVVAVDALAIWTAVVGGRATGALIAGLGGLLLVDGAFSVLRVAGWTASGARVRTDFQIAAAETRIPAALWFVLFLAVNAAIALIVAPTLAQTAGALTAAARTVLIGWMGGVP